MTSTQSQPSQGPLINAISQGGQPVQRSLPSTGFTHSQQPKQSLQSTAYLSSQQPHCPFPETLHHFNQHRLLDAVFPLSEQYQGRFPNATLGDNYPVQGFLSEATLEQSQQLQKILPDIRCVKSHPAQRLPLTQRSQPQEMLTSDMLPLTREAWGPLSAVAYKDSQPLLRCVYPPTLLTHGTVPCIAIQSAQKPVTSALFTQPHQSHGLLPGSGQGHIQGALLINSQESCRQSNKMLHPAKSRDPSTYLKCCFYTDLATQGTSFG